MLNSDTVQLNNETMQELEKAATMGFTNTPNIGAGFNFAGRTVGVEADNTANVTFGGMAHG